MAWIQVHQTLKDHRKLFDAADELEISPPHMMGLLISFWLWALDNAPTGKLDGITHRMIARAAQYEGDAEKLAAALIRAGWLDENEDGELESILDSNRSDTSYNAYLIDDFNAAEGRKRAIAASA